MLNLLKTAVGLAPRPHNPNVSVQVMQGRWLAMTETPESIAFDAASLRTLYDLTPPLRPAAAAVHWAPCTSGGR